MKTQICFILMQFIISQAAANECPKVNNTYDFEVHWNVASDIFFGRIVEGKYKVLEDQQDNLSFKVSISETFKGKKTGEVWLSSSNYFMNPEFVLGHNFIFFLYDSNSIGFCSLTRRAELEWSNRDDIEDSGFIKKVLEHGRK